MCSKVWNDAQKLGEKGVRESVLRSIEQLQVGYLDLFLVHWPVPGFHVSTYKTLETFVADGLIKNLGVSNYNQSEYEELLSGGITVLPVVNQIEVSPLMYRRELVDYFVDRGVKIAAYKPLQRGAALSNKEVVDIAERLKVPPSRLLLRWSVQKQFVVIAKTTDPERMAENLNLHDFDISKEDMETLDAMTTIEGVEERERHEKARKEGM